MTSQKVMNFTYEVFESVIYVNAQELVTHIDHKVRFARGDLVHEARRVEIFDEEIPPKVMRLSDFIITFAMSVSVFCTLSFFGTKESEKTDMTKSEQHFVAQILIK